MNNEAKLGLFVVVVGVVFFIFTINMGSFLLQGEHESYYIYFDKVQLLERGAPVLQSGIDIGFVEKISRDVIWEPTMIVHTVVEVKLNDQAIVTKGSVASIGTVGLMGEKYIEISYGQGDLVPPGSKIKGESPYALDQVIENANDLSAEIKKTIESFNKIIGDESLQTNMVQLIKNLEEFSSDINTMLGGEQSRMQTIIANAAVASDHLRNLMATAEFFMDDLHGVMLDVRADLKQTIHNTSELTGSLKKPFHDDLPEIAANLKEFSSKLNTAIERVDRLAAKFEDTMDSNRPHIDEAMKNVNEFTSTAKQAAQRVDRMLDDIKQEQGLIGTLIYDKEMAQSAKASVTEVSNALANISDIPNRFSFQAELLAFTEDERFNRDQSFLRADMGIQYDITDDVYIYGGGNDLGADTGLELQMGYRYGDFTFHGGMIETELGLGVDWQVIHPLALQLETVGITDSDKTRLDAYVQFMVWKNLYIKGGVQDVTDEFFPALGMRVSF
ncbi:MAG: MCE family protein [bacterium]|nr:MCE family protein [bacterium]